MINFILVEALTFGLGNLVQAAKDLKVKLHLLTRDPSIYFYELEKIKSKDLILHKLDTFNQYEIINYCLSLKEFGGIINLTDTWTNIVQEVSIILNCQIQDSLSLKICRDKSLLRSTLFKKGLSKAKALVINIYEEFNLSDTKYPVIIKDPKGTGSKNVYFASNSSEVYSVIEKIKTETTLKKVLMESYLKGALYSAETISYKGETKLLAISSRILSNIPTFMEKALCLPLNTRIKELRGVEPWINEILSAISYDDGFAHTEFIITNNGFEVVEINPRLGGIQIGEALCQSYNYNIYKSFMEIALKIRPKIFSLHLNNKKALAQVLVYAPRCGIFSSFDDKYIDKNITTIYPCAQKGKKIKSLTDQSSCIAIVFTEGSNSEIALLNALAEANKIQVFMK